jgi:hypothetical protein
MSKLTGNRAVTTSGRRRTPGVQIIDITHKISARRRAKLVFWVLLGTVGALTAVILSAIINPILAVLIGILTGLAVGGIGGVIAFIWPALRMLWHWAAELTLFAGLLVTYLALTHVMVWWLALLMMTLAFGGPFGYPNTRRRLMSWIWCAIWRHRLRTAFAAFIAANRYGTQPLILTARPTPAGGRVRVLLRLGLSIKDLEERRDKLAVACWAKDVRVSPAPGNRAALVDVDITARNPLRKTIDSPLPDLIADIEVPIDAPVSPAVIPTALDLPDVPEPVDDKPADTKRRPVRAVPAQTDVAVPEDDDPTFWAD